ncbi:MAG: cation diffusion facilitator family transporter [Deltaproteobacteria bacterium]|nr:cation diffusion facilitator family transporter [Deltaproteobacteria bacterium]
MDRDNKVAILSICVNLTLFLVKYIFALFSGSIALKAESFHSLADVVASSTVFMGLILSKRRTKSFPYGLFKVENMVSLLVAFAILYAAYEIVKEVLGGGTGLPHNVAPAVASVFFVITIAFLFSRYEAKVGMEIGSPSLKADAEHIRVDVLANMVVLVGLLSSYAGVNIDRAAALVVVVFISISGIRVLVDGARVLLDASLDYKTLSTAEKLIASEPQVVEIKDLTGRSSGRYKFIESTIVLKTHDLDKAHFIATRIEENIKEQIKNVDRVLIHYEPTSREHLVYAAPVEDKERLEISLHFGEAPCFVLAKVHIKDKKIVETRVIENPFIKIAESKGILVAEFLVKQSVDVVITRESFGGKGPFYVFSSASVEMVSTDKTTFMDALESMGIGQ